MRTASAPPISPPIASASPVASALPARCRGACSELEREALVARPPGRVGRLTPPPSLLQHGPRPAECARARGCTARAPSRGLQPSLAPARALVRLRDLRSGRARRVRARFRARPRHRAREPPRQRRLGWTTTFQHRRPRRLVLPTRGQHSHARGRMAYAFARPGRIRRQIPSDLDVVHYALTVPIPTLPDRPSVVTL